ncbi:MAG: hypothetical protein ACLP8S_14175 [Solirubrobacteraceae bacterium]
MTKFFIPGNTGFAWATEDTYSQMRRHLEREMGRAPRTSRILELCTRRGRLDCTTRVGTPDPISGDTVIAIFDMGIHQPFVVWHQHNAGAPDPGFEVLGNHAYSVLEFETER